MTSRQPAAVIFGLLLLFEAGGCAPKPAPPPVVAPPPPRDFWVEAQHAHQQANYAEAYAFARNVPADHPNAAAAAQLAEQLSPKVEKLQARLLQKADDAVLLGFANRAILIYSEILKGYALQPERKQDLVSGRYELPAPRADATVAVNVIDMLGEECVVRAAV